MVPSMRIQFQFSFSVPTVIGIMGIDDSQISLNEAQLHNFPAIWPV